MATDGNPTRKQTEYLSGQVHQPCYYGFYLYSKLLFVTALVVITEYYIYPDPAKILDINFLWLGETLFRIMVSALGIIALQLMISVIIPGFIWPFLLGILGLILNLFSLVQKINIEYSPYNVFYIMSKNNNIRNLNHIISYSEYLSLFWMIVFLIAGYFWYAKKDSVAPLSVIKIINHQHCSCNSFQWYFLRND